MNRIRPIFRFVTATCFIMSSVVLPAVAQQPSDRQSLNSLEKAYQQVLFEYFQGNFEQALTLFSIIERWNESSIWFRPTSGEHF
jgi:outer membrane protein assembly factor BamD (BamD/ComL family)